MRLSSLHVAEVGGGIEAGARAAGQVAEDVLAVAMDTAGERLDRSRNVTGVLVWTLVWMRYKAVLFM